MLTTIILLSLLGSVIASAMGTFWYSPITPMGKWHMSYIGFDKLSKEEQEKKIKEVKPHMWKSYLGQFILSFFTSMFIIFVTLQTYKAAYVFVTMIWIAFIIPNIGSALIWGNCDKKLVWKKFFSDSLNNLVTYLLIVFMTTLFM